MDLQQYLLRDLEEGLEAEEEIKRPSFREKASGRVDFD
jgi:hypothetical protein